MKSVIKKIAGYASLVEWILLFTLIALIIFAALSVSGKR